MLQADADADAGGAAAATGETAADVLAPAGTKPARQQHRVETLLGEEFDRRQAHHHSHPVFAWSTVDQRARRPSDTA